ncbi:transporter substrate-binding domain-containing protein [Pseudodesulfovibrio cashew]|uniref:Transporter substrate-binding domain-containing protein n=1 Tax=Pseudodesulfovibrio cashew TaxID=2678688 RepID=A0A6I6JBU6_9BACT|nr:transporter substrate-binding domain-containing protein [Pseudodesulfovibrio cashew]QGY38599.1 transporter substrate-binding domain-containing protein [Pseudodesulfovibrio cashew]
MQVTGPSRTRFSRPPVASALAALILLLLLALPAWAEKTLYLGGAVHEVTAVSFEILKAAYAKLGIKAKTRFYPSKRAVSESAAGFTDGEVNRVNGLEKTFPTLIQVPVPINSIDSIAYSLETPMRVDGWDSLKNLRIGIMRGIRYAEIATRDMKHVTTRDSYDQLFDLLRRHRLDVVISSRPEGYWPEGYWQEKRLGDVGIITNEPPVVSFALYHYLHEKNRELVPAITRVLKSMRESGEMEHIRQEATREYRQKEHP